MGLKKLWDKVLAGFPLLQAIPRGYVSEGAGAIEHNKAGETASWFCWTRNIEKIAEPFVDTGTEAGAIAALERLACKLEYHVIWGCSGSPGLLKSIKAAQMMLQGDLVGYGAVNWACHELVEAYGYPNAILASGPRSSMPSPLLPKELIRQDAKLIRSPVLGPLVFVGQLDHDVIQLREIGVEWVPEKGVVQWSGALCVFAPRKWLVFQDTAGVWVEERTL